MGEVRDMMLDGYGTIHYPSDDPQGRRLFQGLWCDGKEHGLGVLKFENGDEWTGVWQDGVWSGIGEKVYGVNEMGDSFKSLSPRSAQSPRGGVDSGEEGEVEEERGGGEGEDWSGYRVADEDGGSPVMFSADGGLIEAQRQQFR
jgi:hypothetical protein